MDLEEYLRLYGNDPDFRVTSRDYLIGMVNGYDYGRLVEGGLLQFTADSACCWGGPWPGGFAVYKLMDFRETRYMTGYRLPKARKRTGREPEPPLLTTKGDEWEKKYGAPAAFVTTAKPIELKMYGNDDTSWAKYYATVEDAEAELALFKATQPLDFHEVVQGFGFVFTN